MKAIKRINNNVVLCVSNNGVEFIARGKGIGFHEMPYILDIKTVERTYYDIDPIYYSIISEIPDDLLKISTNIIDKARDTIKKASVQISFLHLRIILILLYKDIKKI